MILTLQVQNDIGNIWSQYTALHHATVVLTKVFFSLVYSRTSRDRSSDVVWLSHSQLWSTTAEIFIRHSGALSGSIQWVRHSRSKAGLHQARSWVAVTALSVRQQQRVTTLYVMKTMSSYYNLYICLHLASFSTHYHFFL